MYLKLHELTYEYKVQLPEQTKNIEEMKYAYNNCMLFPEDLHDESFFIEV